VNPIAATRISTGDGTSPGFLRTVVASSTLLDSIIIGNVALGVTYIDMLAWRQFIDQERARVEPSAKGVEALKAQF
jgi:hypothetical protein